MRRRLVVVGNLRTDEYQVRREVYQDRQHLVVPTVMIVEGVHHGSGGPLYYPPEEINSNVSLWNGVPVVLNHPEDSSGNFISARNPGVQTTVGTVFNATVENNKLKAELWIDVQRLVALDPELLKRIENSEVVEVSTGFAGQEEETPGTWHGEEYRAIVRNWIPDHLALLPDAVGACSVEDGCGVRANLNNGLTNEEGGSMKQKDDEITANEKALHALGAIFIGNEGDYTKVIPNVQRLLDSMDSERNFHFLEALYDSYFIYRVLDREKGTARYYQQDYVLNDNEDGVEVNSDPTEVRKNVSYSSVTANVEDAKPKLKFTRNKSKVNGMAKCDLITGLIQNEATQWSEDDREYLLTLEDSVLEKMAPKKVANKESEEGKDTAPEREGAPAAQPQLTDDAIMNAVRNAVAKKPDAFIGLLPAETQESIRAGQQMISNAKAEAIKAIVDNSDFTAEDLAGWDLDKLQKLSKTVAPKVDYSPARSTISLNADGSDDDEIEAMLVNELKKEEKKDSK